MCGKLKEACVKSLKKYTKTIQKNIYNGMFVYVKLVNI